MSHAIPNISPAFAKAAEMGGAVGIRVQGADNIKSVSLNC